MTSQATHAKGSGQRSPHSDRFSDLERNEALQSSNVWAFTLTETSYDWAVPDLYFIASKVVWFFLQPLYVFALLVALWAISRWLSSRLSAWLSVATLLWVVALGATLLWNSLLHQYETAIPLQQPDRIEGVILLGGTFNEMVTEAHDQVSLNGAAERMTAIIRLMCQYPDAPVIFSGFSGRFIRRALSESDRTLRFFEEMTGQTDRIILENQSRNTYQNALYTKELMGFSGDGS